MKQHRVAGEQQRISEITLITEAEEQLLREWNETATEWPGSISIHELIELQANLRPDAIALASGGEQMTYRELNVKANQVARFLRELQVGPEKRVAICMRRSVEMVVAMLGVLKAGGAYVPLDPEYPRARLNYMVRDADIEVMITERALRELAEQAGIKAIELDVQWDEISGYAGDDAAIQVSMDNLAYVIYTSGSSGEPKAVAITQQGLLNLVKWHQEAFSVSSADRATQVAGIGFDAAVWEIWPYLTAGASLHIANEESRVNPGRLRDWLVEDRITMSFAPTPMAEMLLREEWPAEVSLRMLLTGGDKLHQAQEWNVPFEVINNYGPTEGTVVATSGKVDVADARDRDPSIGKSIVNAEMRITDRAMRLVPVGVTGEMYLGGDGVARGYLNKPEMTAERFLPDPYSRKQGSSLYRTGDLGRYRADGQIEFLGRVDDQVKVRGYRVEPGEVEAVLGRHWAVDKAVVLLREDEWGERRLVAFVVPLEGINPTPNELRKHMAERLPGYMVSQEIVMIAQLPLTANGKVDRRALLGMKAVTGLEQRGCDRPRTEVEEMVASIWREVLKVEEISLDDNFFEIGGHSLLATKVVSRVQRVFDVEITLETFFKDPTLSQMALVAGRGQRRNDEAHENQIKRVDLDDAEGIRASIAQLSNEELESLLKSSMTEGE